MSNHCPHCRTQLFRPRRPRRPAATPAQAARRSELESKLDKLNRHLLDAHWVIRKAYGEREDLARIDEFIALLNTQCQRYAVCWSVSRQEFQCPYDAPRDAVEKECISRRWRLAFLPLEGPQTGQWGAEILQVEERVVEQEEVEQVNALSDRLAQALDRLVREREGIRAARANAEEAEDAGL
jgi:hypothetical protein